jgi:copper(I)-binding protein
MLFEPAPAPRPKEIIPLTLIFADGQRVPVKAEVRPPQPGTGHHNH